MLAWSRATKGSAEYSIYVADPVRRAQREERVSRGGLDRVPTTSPRTTRRCCSRAASPIASRSCSCSISRPARRRRSRRRPARFCTRTRASSRDGRSVYAISTKDSDFGRLVQIDIASGKDTVLTPDLKWDVETFTLSDDDRLLAYAVNEDGFSNVVVRDLVTRRALPQPQLPRGVLQNMAFSPDKTQARVRPVDRDFRRRRVDLGSHRRQPRALDDLGARRARSCEARGAAARALQVVRWPVGRRRSSIVRPASRPTCARR